MRTGAAGPVTDARRGVSATRTQVRELAWRSIVRTVRQPAQVIPSIIFPLFLLAVNSSGLDSATKLPGFPTNSYLTFALAVPFIQGGIFAVMNAGTDLARDIETGFFDRLALTPMSGLALVMGQLAGVVALGTLQALVYLVVGLIAGVHLAAGIGGAFVLIALAVTVVFSFACIGLLMAFRLGSGEAVQGMFPVFFVGLFLSSQALPRPLIEQDWFRTVATYNPVSYLLEGVRSLFIDGYDAHALLMAFGCAAAIGGVFLVLAIRSMRSRLVRT